MTERFARAMSACRGFALPFGIFWVLFWAVMTAFSFARNSAQPFDWLNFIVFLVLSYALVLSLIFLNEFLSSRRK
jgi:hypothetical protein